MIIDGLGIDKTVAQRINTLKETSFVHFDNVSGYEKMPHIVPLDNQIHFFDDGIEAIVGMTPVEGHSHERYKCTLVDEGKKRIIKYSFEGKGYQPLRD